jgi:shikimate dehydrogenase
LPGARALLVGAGGAGSAIAHALLEAGVAELAIHDGDLARRDSLVARLDGLGLAPVRAGSADPSNCTVVVNATPMGMAAGDPLPAQAALLSPDALVGCVITAPAVSPWIAAARARGCATATGTQMFEKVKAWMVDFLCAAPTSSS